MPAPVLRFQLTTNGIDKYQNQIDEYNQKIEWIINQLAGKEIDAR